MERIEVRRVERDDSDGHRRVHYTFSRRPRSLLQTIGAAVLGLAVVVLVLSLALTIVFYVVPVLVVIAAVLLAVGWIRRRFF